MKDKALFDGIKQKNIDCFEQLMNRYSSYIAKIVTLIGSKSLSVQDIEEISADVFVSIWQNAEKINILGDSMKSYLAAIARNKTKSALSSKRLVTLPLLEDIISTDNLVSDDVVVKETNALVNRTVAEMGEPDREIFIRRYFYFEKIREIAEHLSMNSKTVETKLLRGKEKLRTLLIERGVTE